jgi:hypothetical protein
MKRRAVAILAFLTAFTAGARGADDLAARVFAARERLSAAAKEILSIDVGDPRSAEKGRLSDSYEEDQRILAAAKVLFSRKGVSAQMRSEDAQLILSLSVCDDSSIYGLSLIWFYHDHVFERFGASRSVQAIERPNQSPEPTVMLVTPRAGARVAPSTTVAHL